MKTPSEPGKLPPQPGACPPAAGSSALVDWLKMGFALGALVGMGAIFFSTPTLATPTFAAIGIALLLSPLVAQLERTGLEHKASVGIVLGASALILGLVGYYSYALAVSEWDAFKEKAPVYFARGMEQVEQFEQVLKSKSELFADLKISATLATWVESARLWVVSNGASLAGNFLTTVLIAPLIVFFMLSDGRSFRKIVFQLVPNRIFESAYIVTHKIGAGISDYIRAKLIEALIVGLLVMAGLWLVGAPYVIVLAVIAGVTNIVPYAGPVLGAIPALVLIGFDPTHANLLGLVLGVFLVANLVDFVLIFPIFVAKLVDLHPVFLLAAVAIGQQYSGLIGMLISIPIASAFKVVCQELYYAVYSRGVRRRLTPLQAGGAPSGSTPSGRSVVSREPFKF